MSSRTASIALLWVVLMGCSESTETSSSSGGPPSRDISKYPEPLQRMIGQGIALLQQDRAQDAIVVFEKAAKQFSDLGISHHFVAMAYSQIDEVNRALEAWDRALALGYDTAELRHGYARALRVLKRFEPALEQIDLALAFAPDDLEYLYWKGFTLSKLQRHAEAARIFEQLVARAPKRFRGWMQLGRARLDLFEEDAALDAFRRALAIEPGNEGARLEIATILGRRGDWEGVLQVLEPPVRGGKTAAAEVHFRLSAAYRQLGREQDAERQAALHTQIRERNQQELRRQGEQRTIFLEAGKAALERRDYDRAIEEFERILIVSPDHEEAKKLLNRARRLRDG
ncbi:MAG: tetratricopeptide repeat protein [Planctomycetota bacterium]